MIFTSCFPYGSDTAGFRGKTGHGLFTVEEIAGKNVHCAPGTITSSIGVQPVDTAEIWYSGILKDGDGMRRRPRPSSGRD